MKQIVQEIPKRITPQPALFSEHIAHHILGAEIKGVKYILGGNNEGSCWSRGDQGWCSASPMPIQALVERTLSFGGTVYSFGDVAQFARWFR